MQSHVNDEVAMAASAVLLNKRKRSEEATNDNVKKRLKRDSCRLLEISNQCVTINNRPRKIIYVQKTQLSVNPFALVDLSKALADLSLATQSTVQSPPPPITAAPISNRPQFRRLKCVGRKSTTKPNIN